MSRILSSNPLKTVLGAPNDTINPTSSPDPTPVPTSTSNSNVDEEILKKAARRYAKSKGITQDDARNKLLNSPELIAKWQ
jgi:hypothetical protein